MSTYFPDGLGGPDAIGTGEGLDLAMLAASDALIEAIASRSVSAADTLAAGLVDWLNQIDADYRPARGPALDAVPGPQGSPAPRAAERRLPPPAAPIRRRSRRRAAATLAVASVVALAGTGVAVASPGSLLYPLHSALLGHAPPAWSALDAASRDLNRAWALIAAAQGVHAISASDEATAATLLDHAHGLLATAPRSPRRTQLLQRQHLLVLELDGLPSVTSPGASTDSPTHPLTQPAGSQPATAHTGHAVSPPAARDTTDSTVGGDVSPSGDPPESPDSGGVPTPAPGDQEPSSTGSANGPQASASGSADGSAAATNGSVDSPASLARP